jgi:hypothetical protein
MKKCSTGKYAANYKDKKQRLAKQTIEKLPAEREKLRGSCW